MDKIVDEICAQITERIINAEERAVDAERSAALRSIAEFCERAMAEIEDQ